MIEKVAVHGAGIGNAEQLFVRILIVDRLAEDVYPVVIFSLSDMSSEHRVKHQL